MNDKNKARRASGRNLPRRTALEDAVQKLDAKYFEDHPGERFYLRKYIPGEYGITLTPAPDMVGVIKVRRGVHVCRPLVKNDGGTPPVVVRGVKTIQ